MSAKRPRLMGWALAMLVLLVHSGLVLGGQPSKLRRFSHYARTPEGFEVLTRFSGAHRRHIRVVAGSPAEQQSDGGISQEKASPAMASSVVATQPHFTVKPSSTGTCGNSSWSVMCPMGYGRLLPQTSCASSLCTQRECCQLLYTWVTLNTTTTPSGAYPRTSHCTMTFGDVLLMIAGNDADYDFLNDVLWSRDGLSW
eukprot:RCo023979